MQKTTVAATMIVAVGLAVNAIGQSQSSQQPTGQSSATQSAQPIAPQPTVNIGSTLQNKANSGAPSSAEKKTSIGKGNTKVTTSQPSSFWVEQVDVDSDGKPEETDFLYDNQRGILYASWVGSFSCKNGEPGTSEVLGAVYAKGNQAGKPPGSGWYVVDVDEGKCGAKSEGEFGCTFDASVNPTACGVATVNNATGEVDVAEMAR